MNGPVAGSMEGLRAVVRESELSGAARRALLVHIDRLPPELAKPHHLRLLREALQTLLVADRAQVFELQHDRLAIVWRYRGGRELDSALKSLGELLRGQQSAATSSPMPSLAELTSVHDLPAQAGELLDELMGLSGAAGAAPDPGGSMDVKLLSALEDALSQADLSPFLRWRRIMRVTSKSARPGVAPYMETSTAWDERSFSVHDMEAALCPGRRLNADPWLFRRLTRTLDRRMLALLANPRELLTLGSFALHLNVATILSAEFLRFDAALPQALRGQVMINLSLADILSDLAAYAFARDFAKARLYRVGLAGMTMKVLGLLDLAAAGLDFVQMRLAADIQEAPKALLTMIPTQTDLVLTHLDRSVDARWAWQNGFGLCQGKALVPV